MALMFPDSVNPESIKSRKTGKRRELLPFPPKVLAVGTLPMSSVAP